MIIKVLPSDNITGFSYFKNAILSYECSGTDNIFHIIHISYMKGKGLNGNIFIFSSVNKLLYRDWDCNNIDPNQ